MSESPPSPQPAASLQGCDCPTNDPADRRRVLDQALDYRGDVTLHTDDGRQVEGYLYDRRADVAQPYVRLLVAGTHQRLRIEVDRIVRVVFSGRDTASGKSWETWVKKYKEKKARGEEASLHPEEG